MCLPYSIFTIYVGVFAVFLPSSLTGDPKFTVTPTNLTVSVGKDIFIDWRYSVDNRNDLALSSPIWNYYDENGTEYLLGTEAFKRGWNWKISPDCPKKFIDPILRLHKYQSGVTGFAGLNITNVTVEDSGRYECKLMLSSGLVPPSSMYLTVIAPTTTSPSTTTPPTGTTASTTASTNITTTAPPTGTEGNEFFLTTGAKAGIGIAVFVCLIIIGGVTYYLWKKKKASHHGVRIPMTD